VSVGPSSPSPSSDVSSASPAASLRGNRRSDDSGSGSDENGDGSTPTLSVRAGRARASAWLAALLGIAGVLGLGVTGGFALEAGAAVGSGVCLAAGAVLVTDADPLGVAFGVVLGVVGASGTALAVAAGPALPVAVLSLAGLASAAMPLGGVDDERLTEASTTLVYALLPFGTVVILDLAFRGVEQFAIGGFPPVAATSPGAELTEFVVLLVVALFGVLVAVREFPAVELAPERDRERIRSVTASVERPLARVTWFAILLVPVAFVVWGTVESGTGPAASLLGTVAPVVGSGLARAALATVGGLGIGVAVTVRIVRVAGGGVIQRTRRGIAAAVGFGLVAVLTTIQGRLYPALVDAASVGFVSRFASAVGTTTALLFFSGLAVLVVLVALLVLSAAIGLGVAPERAGAPAFAAAGLLGGAVLSVDNAPPAAVLIAVVAGMVVWDLGEYGVGITEEVGDAPAAQVEAVHAAAAIAVGAFVAAGAIAGHAVVTGVVLEPAVAAAALAVAFVGVILLAAVVRGG